MRISVVDPPAFTPPYDHALCAALAERGHEVELVTSRFRHGPVPPRWATAGPSASTAWGSGSAAVKAAQHPFDMLRLARRLRREAVDVVHFQWLPLPELDLRLLRAFPRPRVLTAHDVLPREGSPRRRAARLAGCSMRSTRWWSTPKRASSGWSASWASHRSG